MTAFFLSIFTQLALHSAATFLHKRNIRKFSQDNHIMSILFYADTAAAAETSPSNTTRFDTLIPPETNFNARQVMIPKKQYRSRFQHRQS